MTKDYVDNLKRNTLEELEIDYGGDKEKFIKSLQDRLEVADYINEKYCNFFRPSKPINTNYLLDQLWYLNGNSFDGLIEDNKNIDNKKETKDNYDNVNNPYHYTSGKYECIEVMRDTFGDEKLKAWCVLNAFKYLFRCYKKNGDEDLKKANFYLNYIIKNEL